MTSNIIIIYLDQGVEHYKHPIDVFILFDDSIGIDKDKRRDVLEIMQRKPKPRDSAVPTRLLHHLRRGRGAPFERLFFEAREQLKNTKRGSDR
jgi:hypothetical protein